MQILIPLKYRGGYRTIVAVEHHKKTFTFYDMFQTDLDDGKTFICPLRFLIPLLLKKISECKALLFDEAIILKSRWSIKRYAQTKPQAKRS